MSEETKYMAFALTFMGFCFVGGLLIFRFQEIEIKELKKKVSLARQYCIGKENRLNWCEEIFK